MRKRIVCGIASSVLVLGACHYLAPTQARTYVHVQTCWMERSGTDADYYCGDADLAPISSPDFLGWARSVSPLHVPDCEEDEVLAPRSYTANYADRIYVCVNAEEYARNYPNN